MPSSIPNIPPPADQIRFLMEMEHRIPNLLTLLSSALTALLPPDPDAPKVLHDDGSVQEEEERFVDSAREYYKELDDITLLLRSTIHHLRLTRVLPTPDDFVPPPPHQLPPTPFSAPLPSFDPTTITQTNPTASSSSASASTSKLVAAEGKSLGLYGLRVEAGSWRKMRDSLVAMKGEEPPVPDSKEVVVGKGGVGTEEDVEATEVKETPVQVQVEGEKTSSKAGVEHSDEDEEMEEVPEVVGAEGMEVGEGE